MAVPGTSLAEIERWLILETLRAYKGNKAATAKILGIDRRTLYRKLETYDRRPVGLASGEAA
jgi:DNA-binding NtrC family response regulator